MSYGTPTVHLYLQHRSGLELPLLDTAYPCSLSTFRGVKPLSTEVLRLVATVLDSKDRNPIAYAWDIKF